MNAARLRRDRRHRPRSRSASGTVNSTSPVIGVLACKPGWPGAPRSLSATAAPIAVQRAADPVPQVVGGGQGEVFASVVMMTRFLVEVVRVVEVVSDRDRPSTPGCNRSRSRLAIRSPVCRYRGWIGRCRPPMRAGSLRRQRVWRVAAVVVGQTAGRPCPASVAGKCSLHTAAGSGCGHRGVVAFAGPAGSARRRAPRPRRSAPASVPSDTVPSASRNRRGSASARNDVCRNNTSGPCQRGGPWMASIMVMPRAVMRAVQLVDVEHPRSQVVDVRGASRPRCRRPPPTPRSARRTSRGRSVRGTARTRPPRRPRTVGPSGFRAAVGGDAPGLGDQRRIEQLVARPRTARHRRRRSTSKKRASAVASIEVNTRNGLWSSCICVDRTEGGRHHRHRRRRVAQIVEADRVHAERREQVGDVGEFAGRCRRGSRRGVRRSPAPVSPADRRAGCVRLVAVHARR